MNIDILPVTAKGVWPLFAPHHYLTGKYAGHRAWLAILPEDGTPVAFTSIIAAPSGHFKRGWREHRTVVLPDFQGLGIGARLGDWVGDYVCRIHTEGEGRYFSRTMHPRLGAYREASPLWKATSSNKKANVGVAAGRMGLGVDGRASFSHEYVGHRSTVN